MEGAAAATAMRESAPQFAAPEAAQSGGRALRADLTRTGAFLRHVLPLRACAADLLARATLIVASRTSDALPQRTNNVTAVGVVSRLADRAVVWSRHGALKK